MGVYDEDFDEDPDDVEARFDKSHSATQYIGYHARKQLAFDMWWLVAAVWLICIVERHRIGSGDWPCVLFSFFLSFFLFSSSSLTILVSVHSEVTIFSLIFEIVSAYGTVGLSLGNNRVRFPLFPYLYSNSSFPSHRTEHRSPVSSRLSPSLSSSLS
jgi:hypothetical protein